jgi:hypothetical protein
MIITDINSANIPGKVISSFKSGKQNIAGIEIKSEAMKFIGPSLEGGHFYYALRKPRSTREHEASCRRAFRN